ncbi:MAG: hypothetical protein EON92_18700 [Burkholderiales bacterium]|nr:MAG: hypothetical protein EON92_18700 [Burkholderiales bacterium]
MALARTPDGWVSRFARRHFGARTAFMVLADGSQGNVLVRAALAPRRAGCVDFCIDPGVCGFLRSASPSDWELLGERLSIVIARELQAARFHSFARNCASLRIAVTAQALRGVEPIPDFLWPLIGHSRG